MWIKTRKCGRTWKICGMITAKCGRKKEQYSTKSKTYKDKTPSIHSFAENILRSCVK